MPLNSLGLMELSPMINRIQAGGEIPTLMTSKMMLHMLPMGVAIGFTRIDSSLCRTCLPVPGNMLKVHQAVQWIWTCSAQICNRNHEAQREVRGRTLIRMALFWTTNPEGTVNTARAFLFNMDPTVLPYSPAAIVRADHLLGLQCKAASTTCKRAYWTQNSALCHMFWNLPYPLGWANIRTKDMIDMDKAGFKVEASNPKFGKTVLWQCCYLEGEYNCDKKLCQCWL